MGKLYRQLHINMPSLKEMDKVLNGDTSNETITLNEVVKIKKQLQHLVVAPLDRHPGELSVE